MEPRGKTNLLGLTKMQLEDFVEDIGEPAYRAQQIFEWIYTRGVSDINAMSNLGKSFRSQLERTCAIHGVEVVAESASPVDGTTKFLFGLADGKKVESVLIPPRSSFREATRSGEEEEQDKLTLCVSTQVGCPLNCAFCATGTMGFHRNLTAGEIVSQVLSAKRLTGRTITNVVFMGMGEPLLNYENVMNAASIIATGVGITHKRITVSTAGRPNQIRQMGQEKSRLKLAVSLHSAVDETRTRLMPVNAKYPLAELMDAIEAYYTSTRQRVTYEFIFFDGVNDTERELRALVKLARRVPSKINVIPYHSIAFTQPTGIKAELRPSLRVEQCVQVLRSHHLTTMVRSNAGEDIDAACGQLAVRLTRLSKRHAPTTT